MNPNPTLVILLLASGFIIGRHHERRDQENKAKQQLEQQQTEQADEDEADRACVSPNQLRYLREWEASEAQQKAEAEALKLPEK